MVGEEGSEEESVAQRGGKPADEEEPGAVEEDQFPGKPPGAAEVG